MHPSADKIIGVEIHVEIQRLSLQARELESCQRDTGSMSSALPAFELPITITSADIDQLGHVNNVAYLRWVQEAAEAHCCLLYTSDAADE